MQTCTPGRFSRSHGPITHFSKAPTRIRLLAQNNFRLARNPPPNDNGGERRFIQADCTGLIAVSWHQITSVWLTILEFGRLVGTTELFGFTLIA